MTIPFVLYIPGLDDIGIRSGDILSWILFFLLTSFLSILEEKRMLSKHGKEYFAYIQNTGFYTPLRLQKFKDYTEKDTKCYIIQSFLKVSFVSVIFVVIGVITFTLGDTTLVKFPPPEFYINWEYLQNLHFYETVPFLVFLSCILGMGIYLFWNLRKNRIDKKF